MKRFFSSLYRVLVVNKKQSVTTGFSAKPKGKIDNAAGTCACRVFAINWVLYLSAVQCYLTESTIRGTSLTFAISTAKCYAHV